MLVENKIEKNSSITETVFQEFLSHGEEFIYVLIVIKFLKLHDIVKFKSEIKLKKKRKKKEKIYMN